MAFFGFDDVHGCTVYQIATSLFPPFRAIQLAAEWQHRFIRDRDLYQGICTVQAAKYCTTALPSLPNLPVARAVPGRKKEKKHLVPLAPVHIQYL